MGRITVAACLWQPNDRSEKFSLCYSEKWALRLFNGFRRNLSYETRCVLFTDRFQHLPDYIEQVVDADLGKNGYADCIKPFSLNEPMIFAGLDTVVVGNCDKFAEYCFESDIMAMPSHPYRPDLAINGVVLCPAGKRDVFDRWRGENDMEWLRQFDHQRTEALWPKRIISYKAHVGERATELPKGARIVYFHGHLKPHKLNHLSWIRRHWM